MKVVINNCYGGFGLSAKAIELYLSKIGEECFFYKQTGYRHCGNEEYTKITVQEAMTKHMFYVFTKDMGEVLNEFDGENHWYETFYDDRSNKELIETIEELGCELSSGSCAELEIVEIPDNIEFTIEEYDGIESVHEAHRSW